MRGRSWRNGALRVLSPHARNWDYRDKRYPNAGFRVVREWNETLTPKRSIVRRFLLRLRDRYTQKPLLERVSMP